MLFRSGSQKRSEPVLVFGVDSRARLQQRTHRVRMPVLRGNPKRREPVLPHRRGQGRVMPRWAGRTCIHACTWMRAWMCVREPIHAFACAHPSTCTHCVHMCVCIHTHTRVCIHTQACTQDTNPKLCDSRIEKGETTETMTP